MYYRIYVRYYNNEMVIIDEYFPNKKSFYEFIGGFYLGSIKKIDRIDYETYDKKKVKNIDFLIHRRQYV